MSVPGEGAGLTPYAGSLGLVPKRRVPVVAVARMVAGPGLHPGGGRVAREAVFDGLDASIDDVLKGRKIWLPNFQVDDFFACCLQRLGAGKHVIGSLWGEIADAFGKIHSSIL